MFDIGTGSLLNTNELKTGEIKRISVKTGNNGILGCFDTQHLKNARHFTNFISVNFFGGVYYHPYQASVEMKVHTLKIDNFELDRYTGLYLVAALSKSLSNQFSYGNQLSSSMLKQDKIYISLPIMGSEIDFNYITAYIKAIQKLIIKDLVEYTKQELLTYQQVVGRQN